MRRRPAGSGTWGCPGWKSPWHSVLVLLAASVFSSCFLLSQASRRFVPVVADPEKPKEGGNVTFILQGAMTDFISCRWYRGVAVNAQLLIIFYGPPINQKTLGRGYSERETILAPECSLHIRELTINDSATYFATLDKPGDLELATVQIEVSGTPPARGEESGGLSKGAIAGIIVGCVAVVMVIAGVSFFRSTQVSR